LRAIHTLLTDLCTTASMVAPSNPEPCQMLDVRYDRWRCAKCGAEKTVRSVPHNPPTCCGTGMWFDELLLGPSYQNDVNPLDAPVDVPAAMKLRDIRQLELLPMTHAEWVRARMRDV